MLKKKDIRNNKVEVKILHKGNDFLSYYSKHFPQLDRNIYNPIIFFNHLSEYVGDVYRMGRRHNSKWNAKWGGYQQIRHFVRFNLNRKFDEFNNIYHYHIEEKIYVGKHSFSMWKDNETPTYHRVESKIYKVNQLLHYISKWLKSWDKECESDMVVEKLFKPLKYVYGCLDYESMHRKLDDIDRMLNECDKDIIRADNKRIKEYDKINRLHKKGIIDEDEWILRGCKVE